MTTLYGVIYKADDEQTTEHSAHLTSEDAARAGAELACREWDRMMADKPEVEREPFSAALDNWEAMDALRSEFSVSLEIEEIDIADDVVLALAEKIAGR